jgi:type IV secretion/conjugal transfer VirB4 family ATPase
VLALKSFRSTAKGVADLLNWAALIDDGVVQGKDGSLTAGWFYSGPDIESATDNERNDLAIAVNAALARMGAGWASWVEACRIPVVAYPPPEASGFPDRISRLVDAERRAQFTAPGRHYSSTYALIVQFTPPARRKTRINDLIYDDDPVDRLTPASRVLSQFQKSLEEMEDALSAAIVLERMRNYTVIDRLGIKHFRDELVNFLHFALTGEAMEIDLPPAGAYLDTVVGGRELWPGDTPRLGDQYIACVTVESFPSTSHPGMLAALDTLAIPYRWSSRFVYLDHHQARDELGKYRKQWQQKVRGFFTQVFQKGGGGKVDEDAMLMVSQADRSTAEANSGLVTFGYYTVCVVLRDADRAVLNDNARSIVREVQRIGFTARIETINTMEAWLGTLPAHPVPNVRRPFIHTEHLSNLLPLAAAWTGRDTNPCPMYSPNSPALLYGTSAGATPLRINLHVDDVGHTLVFGPSGAGKTTLLATIAIQALRYSDVTIWWFDYKRGALATIKAIGGRHYDIGHSGPTFAPLADLDTPGDMGWAEDFIALCFEMQFKRVPNPVQRDAIHHAMLLLKADTSPGARSLSHFRMAVQDPEVREALIYYTVEGATGGMLDAEHDGMAYEPHMAFELEDLLALSEQTSVPVLIYLFRRLEKSLKGQPAFVILDELAVLMGNPALLKRLPAWIRILRSKNGAIIMATQLLSDAHRSGLLDVLLENCPTKIYLPNEEAETTGSDNVLGPRDYYAAMGLNDRQISLIRHAVKKRDYYLVQSGRDGGCRMFTLELGPIALAFSGATSQADIAAIRALEAEHDAGWPFVWMDQKNVPWRHLLAQDKSTHTMQQEAE